MRLLFSLVILSFAHSASFAQFEPSYRTLTTKDGLPSNTIYDITQGEHGEIMIAHQLGVVRYNGQQINGYENKEGQTPLSNLIEIDDANYLCRNFNDEVFFASKGYVKKIDSLSSKKKGYSSFYKWDNTIYEIKENKIILISSGSAFKNQLLVELNPSVYLNTIAKYESTLYALSSDSVFTIDAVSGNYRASVHVPTSAHKFLFTLGENVLLFSPSESKIESINSRTFTPKYLAKFDDSNKVNFIESLTNGNIVIGTFSGVFMYDSEFNFIGNFFKEFQISCMHEDIEGNLWLGTLQDGIIIVPSLTNFSLDLNAIQNKKTNISTVKLLNDSTSIVGTYQGQLLFISADGTINKYLDFDRNDEIQGLTVNATNSTLYVYCKELLEINLRTYETTRAEQTPPLKDISVFGDTLFCATSIGFYIFVKNDFSEGMRHELWFKKIVPFNSDLFAETETEIFFFDRSKHSFRDHPFITATQKLKGVTNLNVVENLIYFTSENCLYAYENNELNLIFKFPFQSISHLSISEEKFFVASNTNAYILEGENLTALNKSKGLMLEEINGIIPFFGGLLLYDQNKLQWFQEAPKMNRIVPKINVTSIGGSFALVDTVWTSSFSDNQLIVEYEILPNQRAQGSAQLKYELIGPITEMGTLGAETNSLALERLPYGNYSLSLIAYNEDEIASLQTLIYFEVLIPYYETWWFRILILLLLISLALILLRLRIKYLSKRSKEKLDKERLKIRALNAELRAVRNQMNPHFIFNCLSSIQSSILNDESKRAYENLSVFTKLLREALNYTTKEFITLQDEMNFIKKYVHLEQMRYQDSFKFDLINKLEINSDKILFPSLFTQPFVENAILHGLMHSKGIKSLSIEIEQKNDKLLISILDNGIGIEQSKELYKKSLRKHDSFGLQALHERIELLEQNNFTIKVEFIPLEPGTKVLIITPIKKI